MASHDTPLVGRCPHLYLMRGIEVLGVEGQPAVCHCINHYSQDLLNVCLALIILGAPAKLLVQVVHDHLQQPGAHAKLNQHNTHIPVQLVMEVGDQ